MFMKQTLDGRTVVDMVSQLEFDTVYSVRGWVTATQAEADAFFGAPTPDSGLVTTAQLNAAIAAQSATSVQATAVQATNTYTPVITRTHASKTGSSSGVVLGSLLFGPTDRPDPVAAFGHQYLGGPPPAGEVGLHSGWEQDWDLGTTGTATTTSGSPNLTAVTNTVTTNFPAVGATITGAGIPGGTTVLSADVTAGTVVMSANATASASGVAITATSVRLAEHYLEVNDPGRTTQRMRPFYVKYDRTTHRAVDVLFTIGGGRSDRGIIGGSGFYVGYDDGIQGSGVGVFQVTPGYVQVLTGGMAAGQDTKLQLHAQNGQNAVLQLHSGQTAADSAFHAIYASNNNLLSFNVNGRNVLNLFNAFGGAAAAVSIGSGDNSAALIVAQRDNAGSPVSKLIANSGQSVDVWQVQDSAFTSHIRITKALAATPASLVVGKAVLANAATDGFLYLPTVAGTPTGTPTTQAGTVPVQIDTTALKLWAYLGGAWKSVTFA